MTEWDEEGLAVQGTYAISTVNIGMWNKDGSPAPTTNSAICKVCQGWAAHVCVSGSAQGCDRLNQLSEWRTSGSTVVIVYACPTHYEQVMTELVDKYGHASNRYDPDDLAVEVDRKRGVLE